MNDTSRPLDGSAVDDAELVARAQGGDAAAMEQLLTRHFGYVHNLCRRILRDPVDAEDARQEALILAAQRISSFDGRSAFRTWLHTLTRNVCLNAIRSSSRRPKPVIDIDRSLRNIGRPPGNDDDFRPKPRFRPSRHPISDPTATSAQRIDIDAALAALTPAYRDALVLRLHYEFEYEQIAEALQIPLNTVRSRIRRGREELVALLREPDGTATVSHQSKAPPSPSRPGTTTHRKGV